MQEDLLIMGAIEVRSADTFSPARVFSSWSTRKLLAAPISTALKYQTVPPSLFSELDLTASGIEVRQAPILQSSARNPRSACARQKLRVASVHEPLCWRPSWSSSQGRLGAEEKLRP